MVKRALITGIKGQDGSKADLFGNGLSVDNTLFEQKAISLL